MLCSELRQQQLGQLVELHLQACWWCAPYLQLTSYADHVFAGHVPQILGAKNAWVFSKWANTFGPLYKLHVLDHFMLVCTDPDSIMQLTRKGGKAHVSSPAGTQVSMQFNCVAITQELHVISSSTLCWCTRVWQPQTASCILPAREVRLAFEADTTSA